MKYKEGLTLLNTTLQNMGLAKYHAEIICRSIDDQRDKDNDHREAATISGVIAVHLSWRVTREGYDYWSDMFFEVVEYEMTILRGQKYILGDRIKKDMGRMPAFTTVPVFNIEIYD